MNALILNVTGMFKFSYISKNVNWTSITSDKNRKNETMTSVFANIKKIFTKVCHCMKNFEVKGLKILCHWWLTCKVTCTLAGPVRASAHTFSAIETRIWVTWLNSAFLWSPDKFYSVITVCKRQYKTLNMWCV
jgi:hypothetical protein